MGALGLWEPSPSGATESAPPGLFRPAGAGFSFALQPTAHAVGYPLSVLRTCRASAWRLARRSRAPPPRRQWGRILMFGSAVPFQGTEFVVGRGPRGATPGFQLLPLRGTNTIRRKRSSGQPRVRIPNVRSGPRVRADHDPGLSAATPPTHATTPANRTAPLHPVILPCLHAAIATP